MSYSRNFGMRDFTNIVRDARFRVPSTGGALRIGEGVMVDTANEGKLKRATAGVTPTPLCGIVIYEHIQLRSDALVAYDDAPYDLVPLGQYAQMIHGPGAKIWLKNTADKTLYDGRARTGFTMVTPTDLSSVGAGDGLSPDGSGVWSEDATNPWLVVEQVDPTSGLVECRFTF